MEMNLRVITIFQFGGNSKMCFLWCVILIFQTTVVLNEELR